MKKNIIKAFVTNYSKTDVTIYYFDIKQYRIMDKSPLFDDMKLFIGKNIWIETTISPGTMYIKNNESSKNKVIQLWNYFILKRF